LEKVAEAGAEAEKKVAVDAAGARKK